MANLVREQYRPLFGAVYDTIRLAPDWHQLTVDERANRLRDAMRAEDEKYGRPYRFDADFDFVHVVRSLELPG